MKLDEKIPRVMHEIKFLATHDDESPEAVLAALETIRVNLEETAAALSERRRGTRWQRVLRYVQRLYYALIGKE